MTDLPGGGEDDQKVLKISQNTWTYLTLNEFGSNPSLKSVIFVFSDLMTQSKGTNKLPIVHHVKTRCTNHVWIKMAAYRIHVS